MFVLLFWCSGTAFAASGAPVTGTRGQTSGLAAMMGKLPRIYMYPNSEVFRNASAGYVNMYRWGGQSLLKGSTVSVYPALKKRHVPVYRYCTRGELPGMLPTLLLNLLNSVWRCASLSCSRRAHTTSWTPLRPTSTTSTCTCTMPPLVHTLAAGITGWPGPRQSWAS